MKTDDALFLKAITLCGYNLVLNQLDEENWGTEQDIESGNAAYYAVCDMVEFDINEDDEWGSYTNKATAIEIQAYNIEQLISRYEQRLPSEPCLFLVINRVPAASDSPSDFCNLESKITSYTDNTFALSVGEHVLLSGFTVLRIR